MRDFNHTVNVLVKAYFDEKLTHSLCGCAVHNLILQIKPDAKPLWANVFCTYQDVRGTGMRRKFSDRYYFGATKDQIDSTGYSLEELSEIEYSFEKDRCTKDIFGCLMNVTDTLADIHGISLEQKSEAKAMFVKETTL